jgi:MFS superfamily sulfate permease-like transporter
MKNTFKYWTAMLAIAVLSTIALFAQVVVSPDAATPAATTPISITLLIISVVVPIVIAVAKMFVPKLPGWSLPLIAPILGALADYLITGTSGQGTIMGALAGSAGVGLREIASQVQKMNPVPPKTIPPTTPV